MGGSSTDILAEHHHLKQHNQEMEYSGTPERQSEISVENEEIYNQQSKSIDLLKYD